MNHCCVCQITRGKLYMCSCCENLYCSKVCQSVHAAHNTNNNTKFSNNFIGGKMQPGGSDSMFDVVTDWFERNEDKMSSMQTTETLQFTEGEAQMKWWKMNKMVIVKTIKLKKEYMGKLIFTKTIKKILRHYGGRITSVQMESVLDIEVHEKMQKHGWKPAHQFDFNNLYLYFNKNNGK